MWCLWLPQRPELIDPARLLEEGEEAGDSVDYANQFIVVAVREDEIL
jgi:hypothetical protein